jgi:hypothetical protein
MNKQDLEALVKECISEVVAEGYDEFQRADKGSKGVAAKDKAEEDTYGAGYAAGEKAAKARYKKLAEAYKQLKEEGFGLGPKGLDTNDDLDEANLGHNEISSIHREGRFWIATYKTVDGIQEKSFESEEDAKKFLNSLNESAESDKDKLKKYEEYTYTLDGKTVKPEITFLNNILKAMLNNKIYNIGTPENGKVELTPESGKKGTYAESAELDEARFEKGEDVGGKGFEFKKIAKAAEKKYGSKEAGQRVAGAILKKVLKK